MMLSQQLRTTILVRSTYTYHFVADGKACESDCERIA